MSSLHARLITLVGVSVMLIFAISGVVVCWLIEASLWAEFDRGLRDHVASISQMVERDQQELFFEWQEAGGAKSPSGGSGELLEVWDHGQNVAPFGRQPALLNVPPVISEGILNVRLAGNQPGRAVILKFRPRVESDATEVEGDDGNSDADVTMVFARPTGPLDATVNRVRGVLAAVGIGGVLTTLAIVWFAVDLGLKPIDRTAADIAAIGSDSLDQRIDDGNDQPWELRPLIQTINRLLGRLQVTLDRERAFSADVAHELRTPLAGLRAKLDVAISRSRSAPEYEKTIHECLAITQQTSAIIESLLTTTKLTQRDPVAAPVDLQSVILDTIESSGDVMTSRHLTVSSELPEGMLTLGTPQTFTMLFRNLIDNAAAYADDGSVIDLSADETSGSWRVRITNSARDFPERGIENVFERFWRADSARTETGQHSGLGLPLCKRLAESLGGQIHASFLEQRFIVEIELIKYDV